MRRPPDGLCFPVVYRRCRDGDTVAVSRPGSEWIWAIRLKDCSCAELSEEAGRKARAFAESVLESVDQLWLWIPFDQEFYERIEKSGNLLQALATFDRILGLIFVDQERTLGDLMVEHGHGQRPKQWQRQQRPADLDEEVRETRKLLDTLRPEQA